jgi:hypothetical protein
MARQRRKIDNIYRTERRRVRGLSDKGLAKRRAKAEETIERATRELIEDLEKSVAIGSMTAQEAADEFAAFKRKLEQIKRPSEPN